MGTRPMSNDGTNAAARRRRLLFLLPFPPRLDGTHGGSRVSASIIAALSAHHEIALLYLRGDDEASVDERIANRCAVVEEVKRGRPGRLGSAFRDAIAPLFGVPKWASSTWSPLMAAGVTRLARTFSPDVVHFEYHVMGQYAIALPKTAAARVLTEYEPGVMAAHEHTAAGLRAWKLWSWIERRAWLKFERRVIARMDAVIAFTNRDREALLAQAGTTPVACIPFRLSLPPTAAADTLDSDAAMLLFVGNFVHPPNLDAAQRLLVGIFPGVRARVPGATLEIVGPNPPAQLRVRAGEGVHVTGHVPEVGPYLERATLVVVPIRQGGGMRVKLIESLAAGKAVVASPRAVDGLGVDDGVHVALADSDQQFVDVIVALLGDTDRRRRLGHAAREWARASQDPLPWTAQYEALYESLARERRGT